MSSETICTFTQTINMYDVPNVQHSGKTRFQNQLIRNLNEIWYGQGIKGTWLMAVKAKRGQWTMVVMQER